MNKLKDFMNILTGSFNNSEQFDKMKLDNIDFPYAEHVNTICNDKIINLPEDFKGIFMVEESYYTSNGNTHASPHLFLFTQEENGIKLTSYEVPNGYDKNTFTYKDLKEIDEIIVPVPGEDRWSIDTVKINEVILRQAGMQQENIIDCGICSVCNSDLIHSYRVEKEVYGLETALIELK